MRRREWSASRRDPAHHGVVEEGLLATIAALGAVVRQAREDGAEKAGQGFRLRSGSAERGPRAATPPCWHQDIAKRFSSLTPRRHQNGTPCRHGSADDSLKNDVQRGALKRYAGGMMLSEAG